MIPADSLGPRWLAPTWTLTLEMQFYVLAPWLFLLLPRRAVLPVALAGVLGSIVLRVFIYATDLPDMAALVLLPARCDGLLLGLAAAIVFKSGALAGERYAYALRILPLVLLTAAALLRFVDTAGNPYLKIVVLTLVSIGAAIYVLSIVQGAPEGETLSRRTLIVTGRISYSLYLLHLPVLGLMHGVMLGGFPEIETSAGLVVTLAAVPVSLAVAWLLARTIEQPMIRLGRSLTHSPDHAGFT